MTIVFFSRLFYPHIGGVETHVSEISKRLARRGFKVIVITEKFDKKLASKEELQGIEIYRINPGGNNWFKKFIIWMEIFKLIPLINRADIIHCHDVFFWYLPFKFLFPVKPVFTTFHGYETKFPVSIKSKLQRKIAEFFSYGNIVVGDYIKKWYGTKATYTTYGGVETKDVKGKIYTSKRLNILYIGRIEKDTGGEIYLKSLILLKKKGIKFNLEVCGDGSLREKFEKIGKVHGFMKNLKPFIKKSDFIFASSYLSIMEALSCYKFVFSVYDNPLKKDYLQMSPFAEFVSITDSPNGLLKDISYFYSNPDKRKKSLDKGYNWTRQNNWDTVVLLYLKLWKVKS